MSIIVLGIESSCDDTSAAVIRDGVLLSNVIASQDVHAEYGGVVPELASRAHQQNIVPVVDTALKRAGVDKHELSAIAFTRGPGLLGSLHVGTSFAKGLSLGLRVPIVDVNHLHGHVLSHFIRREESDPVPEYPFLCLLVAFDKCAKVMGLPYPGGPHIDRLAAEGDASRFKFAKPHIAGLDYSFSGLKTSFLYTLRDNVKVDPDFVENNLADLAASLQRTIIEILMDKLDKAVKQTGVKTIAIGGGVSANSGVRHAVEEYCVRRGLTPFIPARVFTTDNAAMVAIAGYYKYLDRQFCRYDSVPYARVNV